MSTAQIAAEPLDPADPAILDSRTLGRRFLAKPLNAVCLAYLGIVFGVAIFAPVLLPNVGNENVGDLLNTYSGPSSEHPLGTDGLGRDVLDRLLVGTRVTMIGVVELVLVTFILGLPIGLAAGYFGGVVDRVVGWLTDLSLALPGIAIVLIVMSVYPASLTAAMVTLGVLGALPTARIIRSATLPVRQELYIAAAQVSGLTRPYIISRHVLPRIAGPVIVLASLLAAGAMHIQTGLAFLGLIVVAPAPSWGGMVGEGIKELLFQPWLIWPPGLAITLTTLAFGLLGDAVRDASAERWATVVQPSRRTRRSLSPVGSVRVFPTDALLSVEGLTVAVRSPRTEESTRLIEDVTFDIAEGETVGLLGESGCGKTITAMAVLGLLPSNVLITSGRAAFKGQDLAALSERELRRVRGSKIAAISQEPMASLNPAFRVGWQIAHCVRLHKDLSRRAARLRAVELLERVQLPEPEAVARCYPHELSGGMAQRVAIARALAGDPMLLIADEPTTALDVTIQAEILSLLRDLQHQQRMAILLITHDWGVIADLCARAAVMYAGEVVESADIRSLFHEPLHPYTQALLASNPHNSVGSSELPSIPGSVPNPGAWPSGCHFEPRCRYATSACRDRPVPMMKPVPTRETRCIHHRELMRT